MINSYIHNSHSYNTDFQISDIKKENENKYKRNQIILLLVLTVLIIIQIISTFIYTNADTLSYTHNFTENGKTSDYFTITGNLTTSQGTVTYNNLTLTTALKMESSTQITCDIQSESELTLVFNDTFNGNVKINNNTVKAENGIIKTTVNKGALSITKGDSANLYYIDIEATEGPDTPETPTDTQESILAEIRDTLYIISVTLIIFVGAFLGYVAISRLM